MSKTTKVAQADAVAPREPMAEPPGGWPPDEFTGVCGSFVRDPFTGVRRRADEPELPADVAPDVVNPQA